MLITGLGCPENYTGWQWPGCYVESIGAVPIYIGWLPQWWGI